MRYLLLPLFFLLFCQLAPAQGWEWLNPRPQGNNLSDLDFFGQSSLFCTGDYGSTIGSTDGGATWTIRNTGEHPCPSIVDFVSSTEAWGIAGENAWRFPDSLRYSILRSTDGGLTWHERYQAPHVTFTHLSFPTAQSGWVIGVLDSLNHPLVIIRTADGGLSWSEQIHDSSAGSSNHVFFLNEQEGWITRYHATLRTSDFGETWQWFPTPYSLDEDITFADGQNGWGAGFDDLYHSSNGGLSWVPENLPGDNEWIRSVAAPDANHVFAIGESGKLYRTTNGGQSWIVSVVDSNVSLKKIVFANLQHGWVCGDQGLVLETVNGGISWTRRAGDMITNGQFGIYGMSFSDAQNGWIAGTTWDVNSPILHSSDGGRHWTTQFVDTSQYSFFYDIKAVSATNIWAVGSQVLHSTDGGVHWNVVDVGGESWGTKIVCPDDQVVWIFSGWQYPTFVHRSTDAGATWETHEVLGVYKPCNMTASDANNVWVTEGGDLDEGAITHSSDGGVTWEYQMTNTYWVCAISFVDALHGWADGGQGFARTTDGGATWTPVTIEPEWGPSCIQFLDTLTGWVAGSDRTYRTTDGGTTWERFDTYAENSAFYLSAVDATHSWIACGTSMLRFDGSIFAAAEPPAAAPSSFALYPVYPNPFNSTTTLALDLPSTERARVEIFDITGRLVQMLSDRTFAAGHHTLRFDAGDLPSGLYFARATSGTFHAVQKMILLR